MVLPFVSEPISAPSLRSGNPRARRGRKITVPAVDSSRLCRTISIRCEVRDANPLHAYTVKFSPASRLQFGAVALGMSLGNGIPGGIYELPGSFSRRFI